MQLLKPHWVNHDDGQAIFSVDIHPDGSRFATGGQGQSQDASGRVVIWNMKPILSEKDEENDKCPKLLCQLDQHLGCVNCVRWSQSGRYLASAGDDKVVIIWQLSNYGGGSVFGSNVVNVEWWRCVSTLRGHDGDILDVAWAPHDAYLASVSVDNTVIIWNTNKWPERVRVLRGHRGLVKGVTWDPVGRYVATQADDRTLVVWRTADWGQETVVTKPFEECGGTTSVLRPSWSPDGQYLVSAHAMNNGGPTAQIIDRDHWTTETDFVGHRKPITCVRFSPNILKKTDPKTGKSLQYCCVAIGSRDRSLSIWFTSLMRPLVVVHDVFEDSVLDLAFSSCGRYLFAVSKDGSLAAFTFSVKEMGRTLTLEETDSVYLKMYGKCCSTNSLQTAAAAIIDNPELLKAREVAMKQQKHLQQQQQQLNLSNTSDTCSSMNSSLQRGPDKQIERRTADGRRRITPVFIPPSADGTSMKTFESFSTSRQEKSRIVIEKLDGVVEPNVTTPNKNRDQTSTNSSSNSNTPTKPPCLSTTSPQRGGDDKPDMPPPPELDGVNPGITARLERVGKNQEKSSDPQPPPPAVTGPSVPPPAQPTMLGAQSVKRKLDDHQPISMKRKRGRPPLDRTNQQQAIPGSSATTPASPPPAANSQAQPLAAAVSAGLSLPSHHHLTPAPASVGLLPAPLMARTALPPATLGKKYTVQVSRGGGDDLVLMVENGWREVAGAASSGAVGRSLHHITAHCGGALHWTYYSTSLVVAVAAGDNFVAVATADGGLQLLCSNTGFELWPSIQLSGACACMCVRGDCILLLTTTANITIYDVSNRSRPLSECVRHLVEGRVGKESVKSIHLIKSSVCSNDDEENPRNTKHVPTTNEMSARKVISNGIAKSEGTVRRINGTDSLRNSLDKTNSIINGSGHSLNKTNSGDCNGMDIDERLPNTKVDHQSKSQKSNITASCNGSLKSLQSMSSNRSSSCSNRSSKWKSLSALERYTPVIVLGSGEVFSRCNQLESWLQLGQCSAVRRALMPQYTSLPPPGSAEGAAEDRPLATLLRHTTAYVGSTRGSEESGACGSELKGALTETFLKKMLTSSAYLASRSDYAFWYTRLVHFYVREGEECKLRRIFDELLSSCSGDGRPVSTILPQHQRLLGVDRHKLLRGYLSELLLVDTTRQLQRLYTEYKELLDAASLDSTQLIMI